MSIPVPQLPVLRRSRITDFSVRRRHGALGIRRRRKPLGPACAGRREVAVPFRVHSTVAWRADRRSSMSIGNDGFARRRNQYEHRNSARRACRSTHRQGLRNRSGPIPRAIPPGHELDSPLTAQFRTWTPCNQPQRRRRPGDRSRRRLKCRGRSGTGRRRPRRESARHRRPKCTRSPVQRHSVAALGPFGGHRGWDHIGTEPGSGKESMESGRSMLPGRIADRQMRRRPHEFQAGGNSRPARSAAGGPLTPDLENLRRHRTMTMRKT